MSISFKLKKTSDISLHEEGFLNTSFTNAFKMSLPCENYFSWKYRENPFGESLHLFSYVDGIFAGCRSFWNLGFSQSALQCVDSFTNANFRGIGIFKLGSEFLLSNHDLSFYNAPNELSERQYLKYGWRHISSLKPKISLLKNILPYTPEINWSEEAILWRYKQHPYFLYKQAKIDSKYYIFRIKKGVPIMLGYSRFDPGLYTIYNSRILPTAYYGHFSGFALEFGRVTNILEYGLYHNGFIDSYWLDMF